MLGGCLTTDDAGDAAAGATKGAIGSAIIGTVYSGARGLPGGSAQGIANAATKGAVSGAIGSQVGQPDWTGGAKGVREVTINGKKKYMLGTCLWRRGTAYHEPSGRWIQEGKYDRIKEVCGIDPRTGT